MRDKEDIVERTMRRFYNKQEVQIKKYEGGYDIFYISFKR